MGQEKYPEQVIPALMQLLQEKKELRERTLVQMKKMLGADTSTREKIAALAALQIIPPARSDCKDFADLVLPLLESKETECRLEALRCLPRLKPAPDALSHVVRMADDPDLRVRGVVTNALIQIGQGKYPDQVIPALIKLLQDKEGKVVQECLQSQWGQYSSPELDELFIKLSHDPRYRHNVIYFCLSTQQHKSPAVCRRLVEALDEADGRAAWGLTYGVGKDSRALVEEGLLRALPEETNSSMRQQEFEILKNVASAKSWKYLKLVSDSDEETEEVKRLAKEILEGIISLPSGLQAK
jgi:hypothetical protein